MQHQKIERAFKFLKKCQKVAEKTKLTSDVVYGLLMDLDIKYEDIVSNEKIEPLAYYDKWGNGIERSSYNFVQAFYNYWVSFNNKITWIYKPYVKIYIYP